MSGLAALEVKYPLLMAQAIVWEIKEGNGHNVTCGKTHETGVDNSYTVGTCISSTPKLFQVQCFIQKVGRGGEAEMSTPKQKISS